MVSRLTLEFLLLVISAHKLLVVCMVNSDLQPNQEPTNLFRFTIRTFMYVCKYLYFQNISLLNQIFEKKIESYDCILYTYWYFSFKFPKMNEWLRLNSNQQKWFLWLNFNTVHLQYAFGLKIKQSLGLSFN